MQDQKVEGAGGAMTLIEWLEKQEALCEKAHPGPWDHKDTNAYGDLFVCARPRKSICIVEPRLDGTQEANYSFISASRLSLPTALKIIRAWQSWVPEAADVIAERILREEAGP